MISPDNLPLRDITSDADFTMQSYRTLILLAKRNYEFSFYGDIPRKRKFVLWRHDCDISLNRAYSLAKIESELGVFATYFVNPHCEFYNIFEKSQVNIVLDILNMGHQIGLHFDASFYDKCDEASLNRDVAAGAALLEGLYGFKPSAFSFHNPESMHLACEAEYYGGLVNCYSKRFKEQVPYCSDSNGYWRFRSLHEVLSDASDPCLQVLTHPDWWQDSVMPPRQRIFRSVFGRAESVMRKNDDLLERYDRSNHAGDAVKIQFLKRLQPQLFFFCDYLWNTGNFQSLFLELWRLHERQLFNLCKAGLWKHWKAPAIQINSLFQDPFLVIDRWKLFKLIFSKDLQEVVNINSRVYDQWSRFCNALIAGRILITQQQLEDGCKFLCANIESVAAWGKEHPINFDGIDSLDSIGIQTHKALDGSHTDLLAEEVGDFPNYHQTNWEQVMIEIKNTAVVIIS